MNCSSQFKMVLLGESAVGKSSLALRFAKGQYHDNAESTIGAAFITHTLQIDQERSVKIELWDTAGQERYHSLAPIYYRGAKAALVVYDLTHMESFRRAKMWVRELHQVNGNDMVIGLAGNKVDLAIDDQRQIDTRTTIEYAEDNGLIFLETSAKRGDNVIEMFMSIAKAVIAKQPVKKPIDPNEEFQPKPNSQTSVGISCCCGVGGKDESKS